MVKIDKRKKRKHGKRENEIDQYTTPGAYISNSFHHHIGHYSIDAGFVFGCQVILGWLRQSSLMSRRPPALDDIITRLGDRRQTPGRD